MEKESINLNCPVAATLQLIGGKYKALLLWHLSGKVLRFNELRRLVPEATAKMLTQQLRELERDGLIRRERDPADQRRTVVEATPKGAKMVARLSDTIETHYQWLEESLGKQKLGQLYELLDQLIELEQP